MSPVLSIPAALVRLAVPALFAASLVMASGASIALAQEASLRPDTVTCVPPTGEAPVDPCGDGSIPVVADPSLNDPQPTAWERIVVGPDGRTLDVYFWMGVLECNGLHSVEVTPTDDGVSVTVLTGLPEGVEAIACIDLAQLYRTTVTLETPLIEGGVE
ncbi:hypothetical protein BH24CHL9_BH24CHL9_11860 [soil metagenome]